MNSYLKTLLLLFATLILSCGGDDKKKNEPNYGRKEAPVKKEEPKKVEPKNNSIPPSKTVDLDNKGVGPIKSVTLGELDSNLASEGEAVFKKMCTACHRTNKKFIGPSPQGILKRRSPEWVMNMILNPEVMVKEDPLAKALLIEFNGSPMANQNLTKDEARAVLEYFRTL